MDETQRRKAQNEAVFREVNERIEDVHRRFALEDDDEGLQIVCECDRADCTERLEVSIDVYERVRSDSSCFFVSPGHEDPTVEDVVDSGGNYVIVRKRPGEARKVAAETDPRS